MTLEESREIIPLMESMIGQIEEQQTLMAEMLLEMQNREDVYKRQYLLYPTSFQYYTYNSVLFCQNTLLNALQLKAYLELSLIHILVSCHSMRKTFGYHAWKQGAQPALLMGLFNHLSLIHI